MDLLQEAEDADSLEMEVLGVSFQVEEVESAALFCGRRAFQDCVCVWGYCVGCHLVFLLSLLWLPFLKESLSLYYKVSPSFWGSDCAGLFVFSVFFVYALWFFFFFLRSLEIFWLLKMVKRKKFCFRWWWAREDGLLCLLLVWGENVCELDFSINASWWMHPFLSLSSFTCSGRLWEIGDELVWY